MCKITSSTNSEFRFFLCNLDAFHFFFLPECSAGTQTSSTVLNKSGESGHPCLGPDFRGLAFSFSSLKILLVVDLLYMAFLGCVMFLLYPLY